jgi:coproporphyrinogen III oxidase-like Fe-S oxidoreductase
MCDLFRKEVENRIDPNGRVVTFSEIGVPIDQISRDEIPSEEMIEDLFQRYGINFSKFKNQYAILVQAF